MISFHARNKIFSDVNVEVEEKIAEGTEYQNTDWVIKLAAVDIFIPSRIRCG